MASEYEKKTVAQLQELLKARGLTTSGKKAELVARLQEADTAASATKTEAKPDAAEDIIDWDDEAPTTEAPLKESAQASTEAGAASIAAGGQGQVPNPVAVPNQTLGEDPAKTNDLHIENKGDASEQAATEEKPAVDYSIGLQPTEIEEELKKRKARAEKFGIVAETQSESTEAEKALERAKRFGTGGSTESGVGVSRLDQALPAERERKRGRGDEQGGRGGKRRNFGGAGGRNRVQNRKSNNPAGRSNDPKPVFSDKDKAAAEARKKRFSAAA
ncbi:hypothetical protein UA08_05169 [Talaromyces atroroseus]|uniref:SAP domain-containing protein n=1 Tax=Talaromyces atroroseus TaxID=1441469 RepID=A0A225AXL3_TALAT|nr:hypothetical protein UA08_05169 [Talaromyces atroroseus]OKL59716.1 hypothetical protein UA08_05169 [Talaromyces atroroseus]